MTDKEQIEDLGSRLRTVIISTDRYCAGLAAQLQIGVTELTALGHLVQAGHLTPKELSALLGLTTGTITGVADRLVAAGLVRRDPHPTDRRSIRLRPTPAGTHARHWAEEQFNDILATAAGDRLATIGPDLTQFFDQAATLLNDAVRPRTSRAR